MERKPVILSVIVLAKNEQERIAKCLESVAWADEVIVIDNGSEDNTVSIAKKMGAKVVKSGEKSFAALRWHGATLAKGDWLLYVDADERITPELKNEIQETIGSYTAGNPEGYSIKRRNFYLGHPWPTQDKMQRLFLKSSLKGWFGQVHETARVTGVMETLKNPLEHNTHRTLEEMVAKTNEWSLIEAKLRFEHNHPPVVPWRLMRVMVTGFFDSFIHQQGWRAGTVGWIESLYQAFSMFITYAKLWELQEGKSK